MKSFVRARGRVKGRVAIAWLEARGQRACSTDDASFEIVTADETTVRVRVDHDTAWKTWLRGGYSGPWKDIEEEVGDHPFRDRRDLDGEDVIHYETVRLDDGLAVEVWGAPELTPGEGSYREATGKLASITATRVERYYTHESETPWGAYVLLLAAIVFGVLAPFGHFTFALLRCALLAALFGLRWLHVEATPFGPREKSSVLAILQAPVWGYILLGYLLPLDVPWIRLGAAVILAGITGRWAVKTAKRPRAIYDALLSSSSVEGVLDGGRIRTEQATLVPEEIAVRWIEDDDNDHVTVAPLGSKWVVVESRRASLGPVFERARRWDRVMPLVYVAFVATTLALFWPRF